MKKLVYFLIVGLAFTAPQVAHSDPMKELPPVLLERLGDDECTQWVMDKGVRRCADPNLAQESHPTTAIGGALGVDRTTRPTTGATRGTPPRRGMR